MTIGCLGTIKQFIVGYAVGGFIIFLLLESFQWFMFLKDDAFIPIDASAILPYHIGGIVYFSLMHGCYLGGERLGEKYGSFLAISIILCGMVVISAYAIALGFAALVYVEVLEFDSMAIFGDLIEDLHLNLSNRQKFVFLMITLVLHAVFIFMVVLVGHEIHKKSSKILPVEKFVAKMVMVKDKDHMKVE